jgi:two-component system, sensor histidine kinase and response regulator
MDDYISKPLNRTEMSALIERLAGGRAVKGAAAREAAPNGARQCAALTPSADPVARDLPIFSREKLLDELDGDEVLLQRMVALFQQNTPVLLDNIRSSIANRCGSDLARSAHALLSSLGAFGAKDARHLTGELEAHAHDDNYGHIDQTFAALERETAEICTVLATFVPSRS